MAARSRHPFKVLALVLGALVAVSSWSPAPAAVQFSDWTAPVNLGPIVNSTSNENFPTFSSDRQSLHFNSDRPGGHGGSDLYVTTRTK